MRIQKGFTLIELIVIMAIFGLLLGLVGLNLSTSRQSAVRNSAVSVLVSELKSAQLKSMQFDTQGEVSNLDYGVYFTTDSYILFSGSTYNNSDPDNYIVNLDNGIEFSEINLPSDQIVFVRGSGEVLNFDSGQNYVVLSDTRDSTQYRIQFNKFGVITYNKL